ncbi:MAG: TVP38/TMEM64 family protein [Christensenellales bacterium]
MKLTKKQWIWCIILVLIIATVITVYYIGKNNGWFSLFESKEKIQEYVASFGALAPLVFLLLQFVQVILSPIPGSITTVAGGVMFGFFYAFIISTIGVFLGSVCAFLLGKMFGRPLVERIVGKTVVDKYMKTVSSRQKIVLILMFVLPFFPDDILCLIAGLSAMRLPYFSLIVILTRPWGLLFSALVGSGMITMPDWGWIILIVIAIVLFIITIKYAPIIEERTKMWLEKKFIKSKDTN